MPLRAATGVSDMDFAPSISAFVSGFPDFLIQLGIALGLFITSLFVYVIMTPHKELDLIRAGNPSAALAFGGVVVGLALPLGACLTYALGVMDVLIWGIVTLLLQILAFRFADIFLRHLPRRIAEGDVAAAVFLMSVKIGLALIIAGAIADPNMSVLRGLQ
jgi:putative membrane protein